MRVCRQNTTQTVWEHGEAVREKFRCLVEGRTDGFRLPDWWAAYATRLLGSIHPDSVWDPYTLYHDCGKPYCRVVDSEGKAHFPDHATVSRKVWADAEGSAEVGHLITHDMAVHVLTAAEIDTQLKAKWSAADAATLLVAALAEVHANADMFGGIESVSFKSKLKNVERRGRQICKSLFPTPEISK